ncbi:MAG: biopolymer transporter ExbD [Gemmatimonadetes bacterium]|nr:biopolymer transporter ExbD [Gemmatimonadota bacterium]MCZ6759212.1 biopolymer transporter ExbD [Gemmatimonadota bacterium]
MSLGKQTESEQLPLVADINVTSLVDVAFVLLIIFMITAPIMQGGVDVQLPRAEARPLQPRQGLVVTVNRDGEVFIDDDALTYDEFRATFQAVVQARDPTGLYLRGDSRVSYGQIVRVLAVMINAGVGNVGMIAESEIFER